MKKLTFIISFAIVLILTYLTITSTPQAETQYKNTSNQNVSEVKKNDIQQLVYVCTGGYSKRYHSTPSCRGLNNCKGDIIEISVEKAVQKGRTPCKICF